MTLTVEQISTVVGIVCAIVGAIIGYAGSQRLKTLDATGSGKEKGELVTDIKYIKNGIDELKVKQKEQDDKYIEIRIEVAKVDQACKSLHKRVDHWEEIHDKCPGAHCNHE